MPDASGMEKIKAAMTSLRAAPLDTIGGSRVVRNDDLAPAADVVVFHADDGARLTVRPSGTEPKIKMYYEMVARVSSTSALASARQRLATQGEEVRNEIGARLGL